MVFAHLSKAGGRQRGEGHCDGLLIRWQGVRKLTMPEYQRLKLISIRFYVYGVMSDP